MIGNDARSKTKILVIDNDEMFVKQIETQLTGHHYSNVIGKTTIEGALNYCMVNSFHPAIIITEYEFEGSDFTVLMTQFKTFNPNVNIIVLSNTDNLLNGFKSLNLGACAFFRKIDYLENVKLLLNSLKVWIGEYNKIPRGKFLERAIIKVGLLVDECEQKNVG